MDSMIKMKKMKCCVNEEEEVFYNKNEEEEHSPEILPSVVGNC